MIWPMIITTIITTITNVKTLAVTFFGWRYLRFSLGFLFSMAATVVDPNGSRASETMARTNFRAIGTLRRRLRGRCSEKHRNPNGTRVDLLLYYCLRNAHECARCVRYLVNDLTGLSRSLARARATQNNINARQSREHWPLMMWRREKVSLALPPHHDPHYKTMAGRRRVNRARWPEAMNGQAWLGLFNWCLMKPVTGRGLFHGRSRPTLPTAFIASSSSSGRLRSF